MFRIGYFFLAALLFFSCQKENQSTVKSIGDDKMEIKISSNAFGEGEMIPKKYTCDGEDISPPLQFIDVPKATKTLALICDDPDAPMGIWVHWVLFNLPGDMKELAEAIKSDNIEKMGAKQGTNSFQKTDYGGPCPPGGTHRYFFKLYSLDCKLDLKTGITKKQLLKSMEEHIVAKGQLMGKYSR